MARKRAEIRSYAKEEFRAEFSSLFLSQEIHLPLSKKHIEQGSSYIANWLSVLENTPQIIFDAAKDAGDISDYLYEHIKTYEVAKNLHPERSNASKKISDELIVVGYDHLIDPGLYHPYKLKEHESEEDFDLSL